MGGAQPTCIAQDQIIGLLECPTLAIVYDENLVSDPGISGMLLHEVEGIDAVLPEASVEGDRGTDDSS